jgi:hypothetical protein
MLGTHPRFVPLSKPCPEERYNRRMARGWESKSVEAQQDEAATRRTSEKPRLTREDAARLRETETLRLSLRNVLQQLERSHDARHRAMLQEALAELERRIRELGT